MDREWLGEAAEIESHEDKWVEFSVSASTYNPTGNNMKFNFKILRYRSHNAVNDHDSNCQILQLTSCKHRDPS